ncbi:vWA domain-containing protein [Persicitalea jodogahamensis]|uniref:vWA domain-containing protein n=1 Tax=Persicitalea jodogahamensis TaxID=402147 RepID=UPI00167ACB28|nr:VWA domain-containing protein [Persicitalea jodogahamensis]
MIERHTNLSANIVAFCRYLRAHGFRIGPEEEATALRAASLVTPNDRGTFALALQVSLTRSVQEVEQFGVLFEKYWRELESALDSKIKEDESKKSQYQKNNQPSFDALKSWLNGNKNTEETETATYSTNEALSQQDFSLIPADQLADIEQLLREVSQSLARKVNRRREKTLHAREFDLRNTLRRNLRRGGELVDLAYKRPRRNRMRLVVLADVSKSMDLYSAFLIQFLYAFQRVFRRIETFVFSTDLHRVTAELKEQNFQQALEKLTKRETGWSGGTRIGGSLQTFVTDYGRLLNRETIVVILSDGWDTEQPEQLADALRRIQQKSRKVVWLNPLAGQPGYEPRTAAMQAALPHVDVFASAHNVSSLRALGNWL